MAFGDSWPLLALGPLLAPPPWLPVLGPGSLSGGAWEGVPRVRRWVPQVRYAEQPATVARTTGLLGADSVYMSILTMVLERWLPLKYNKPGRHQ